MGDARGLQDLSSANLSSVRTLGIGCSSAQVLPRRVMVHGSRDRRANIKMEIYSVQGSSFRLGTRQGYIEVFVPR